MVDALKRASAKRITVVTPFYGYARQDKKHRGREPISARLVADLFKTAGANRLMAVDLHTAQIQGFFDGPVDHLFALPLLAGYVGGWVDTLIIRVGDIFASLPSLLAPGATVIWTRAGESDVREIFALNGFTELAFDAPEVHSRYALLIVPARVRGLSRR